MKRLLLFIALASVSVAAEVTIPDARRVNWVRGVDVGVIGGIDQYLNGSGHANERSNAAGINAVTAHSADNTGATNTSAAISAAINAAGSGQAVYLPLGVYRMDGGISVTTDNTTLRGEDGRKWITSDSTHLLGTGSKSFEVESGMAYQVGAGVRVWRHTMAQVWMQGTVSSYSGTTLSVDVTETNTLHTSTTSNAIASSGTKTFTVGAGLNYIVGSAIRVQRDADPAVYMQGTVSSYSSTTLVIGVTESAGSGTFTDWQFRGTYDDWKVSTVYLRFSGASSQVLIGSTTDYAWSYPNVLLVPDAVSGLMPAKGDSDVTVASTTGLSVGQFASFTMYGMYDAALMDAGVTPVVHTAGYDQAIRNQLVRITDITGTKITFSPALHFDLPAAQLPKLSRATQVYENIGIEGMTMGWIDSTAPFCLSMAQGYNSWFNEIEAHGAPNRNIAFRYSLRCEMRNSWAWGRRVVGGTNGAALYFNWSHNNLIEDNVIGDNFPGVQVNGGSSGNAFVHNYLNDGYGTTGGSSRINLNHGPHNSYNLVEGNVAPHIMVDGYFGSASDDTLFRNFLYGVNLSNGSAGWVVQCRFTRNYNVHGNLMGQPGVADGVFSYGNPYFGGAAGNGLYVSAIGGNPHPGLISYGTITNRVSDTEIQVTFDVPVPLTRELDGGLYWPDLLGSVGSSDYWVTAVAGNVATFTNTGSTAAGQNGSITGGAFPAEGTAVRFLGGPLDFPEFDSDAQNTSDEKGNSLVTGSIWAQQSLSGNTLVASYTGALTAPAWWTSGLQYPAVRPEAPQMAEDGVKFSHLIIPAAFEYWREPLGEASGTGSATVTTLNATTLNIP